MKKKIKIILMCIIIILLSFIIIKIYDSDNNNVIKNTKLSINKSSLLSMLFETDEGIYEVVSDTQWPTSGYNFNSELSGCEHGGTLEWENNLVKMESSYTDKCFVYFNKVKSNSVTDIIESQFNNNEGCSVTANGTTGTVSDIATTNEGLCAIGDGMYGGTTYYYRGAVNNNWVKFGQEKQNDGTYKGIYWRIVRFNGDGSIRMIYSGTTPPTEATSVVMTGEGTQVGTSAYNNVSSYDASYVGYYYMINNGHANVSNGIPSTIANYLLNPATGWYYANGLSEYSKYIDESGKFCNDRYIAEAYDSTYTGTTGYGSSSTAFAPYRRTSLATSGTAKSQQTAITSCTNSYDVFILPTALISMDELLLAGARMYNADNLQTYLNTEQIYWTMSPHHQYQYNHRTDVTIFHRLGRITYDGVGSAYGVRPVINLKTGTMFTGDGTWNNPYEVVETN